MIGVEMGASIKLSSNSLGVSSSLLPPVCNALNFHRQAFLGGNKRRAVSISEVWFTSSLCPVTFTSRQRTASLEVHATVTQTEQPKWWERNGGPNMIDIHSTQEFLNALSEAGERLVVVEFYGTWCASCRALFPKLCRTAKDHGDILFLKVDFDENKPMCRSLNVKMLPHFHFYRGADGQLEAFSCSLAKFQKIKEAIELHNTARCSIGPPRGVGDLILDTSPQLQESTGA